MERIEKLKDAIKDRVRLVALSALFLGCTTFASTLFFYLTGPEKYPNFDLISVIIGSLMGQVTLLLSMTIITAFFKKPDEPEETPANLESIKDLTNIDPDQE